MKKIIYGTFAASLASALMLGAISTTVLAMHESKGQEKKNREWDIL